MNIILKRIRHQPKTPCAEPVEAIDGQIWIEGQKVCDCAENAHHCLPPGRYEIELVKNKKFGRKMPSYIQYGNGVYNLQEPVILVGTFIAPGCLTHSRLAFNALYDRIRKNIERGNQVTLVITS